MRGLMRTTPDVAEPQTRAVGTDPVPLGRVMAGLGPRYFLAAIAIAAVSAAALALPTRLLPNSLFTRMTPTRPLDYAFLVASSVLLGLTLAVRPSTRAPGVGSAAAGGLGTYLAIGCPVCNKLVVALLGVGGATTYFAPLQPLLGAVSLGILAVALRRRLRVAADPSCRVPR